MSRVSLPIIIFQAWSPLYQSKLIRKPGQKPLGEKAVRAKVKILEQRWNKWGKKILTELSKTTQLGWLDQDIRIYTVSTTTNSFSHPLTLKTHSSMDYMFDVLVHELIHRLLNNPKHPKKFQKAQQRLLRPFSEESKVTRRHIILHALLSHILIKFYGPARLKRLKARSKKPDYKRSWQIVDELGHKNIIKAVFGA